MCDLRTEKFYVKIRLALVEHSVFFFNWDPVAMGGFVNCMLPSATPTFKIEAPILNVSYIYKGTTIYLCRVLFLFN